MYMSDSCGFLSGLDLRKVVIGPALRRRLTSAAKMQIGPAIVDYHVPDFASRLKELAPKKRACLAMIPTPIQLYRLSNVPEGYEIYVKRDDMTGSTLSGNKVRKLEFILADAVAKNADTVITCGGLQSNFARSTALAARELGMDSHVVLRSPTPKDTKSVGNQGNVFLHKLNGTVVHLVKKQGYATGLLPKMKQLGSELEAEGKSPYLIPVGGSDPTGLWGYIDCWRELMEQGVEEFTDVVVTIGSGGTAGGLAIGNYLAGSKVKMHAISVCDNAQIFHEHVDEMIEALELSGEVKSEQILNIIDGYKGRGYALNTDEEFEFIKDVARSSGVPVDPVYTGKAIRGLCLEIGKQVESGEGHFAGKKILFVHTGGIFGLYDGQIEPYLQDSPVKSFPED